MLQIKIVNKILNKHNESVINLKWNRIVLGILFYRILCPNASNKVYR